MEIKICGITNRPDALAAADAGADALGFIFYPGSPRFISPEQAREIINRLPPGIAAVGVFVNSAPEEILRVAAFVGLTMVQLHGDEPPDYTHRLPHERLIKALAPRHGNDTAELEAFRVRAFLVDSRREGQYGGTGRPSNWDAAALIARRHPLILSGGLSEETLHEAMAAVQPAAVDLNSGVEIAPGLKDPVKVRRAIELVGKCERSVNPGIFRSAARNDSIRKGTPWNPIGSS